MKCSLVFVLLFLAALFSPARAEVPELLSYQGILTDASGSALPDGSYNVAFRLYTVEVGGSAIWSEAHLVTVTKGIFNATLGYTQVLSAINFDLPYYLGISVEGGDELTPRTLLTDAAYAMNARMVKGSDATDNIIPASGRVGIGTTAPSCALNIVSSEQVGLQFNGSDGDWASIYTNAATGGHAGYGYLRNGVFRAYTGIDLNNDWFVALPGGFNSRIRVEPAGNVCIGSGSPDEKLEVEGGILLGNTVRTNAGTLRWTGSDFEGYDGSTWKSFTSMGSGSLPSGSLGNTLRHDGSDWIATNTIYNDGTSIGMGTTTPGADLHIYGSAAKAVRVETGTNTQLAELQLKGPDGLYDYLRLAKYGSANGSSIDGIPLADAGLINTGTMGGAMLIDVMTSNPMYFLTSNTERMRLDANGNLGINTKSPGAKLHVDGNMWDLTNTEGDFKIGDATYRLKFGVATGGGGAGTAGIRVAGGAQKLILGAGTAEILAIDGGGNTAIGGATSNAKLRLFRAGVDSAMVYAHTKANGGSMSMYDEAQNPFMFLDADVNGSGGFFQITRNASSGGFTVDGNYLGTGNAYVGIYGTSSTILNMNATGNGSVYMPADAISSAEILNEPGAASYTNGTGLVTLSGSVTTLGSRSITVPDTGYVMVVATCQANMANHMTGTQSNLQFGVSGSAAGFPSNQDVGLVMSSALPSGLYTFPVTVQGLFSVTAAGTYTYYMIAEVISGGGTYSVNDIQLTLVYIPTGYGSVNPTVAVSGAPKDNESAEGPPINAAAERITSEAFNAERIQRELAALRAEVEALKAEARNE